MVITIFGRHTASTMLPTPIKMNTVHAASPPPQTERVASRSAFRLRTLLAAGLSARVAAR